MSLRFEQPAWLWVALIAAPMGVVALRWFMAMNVWRRVSAVFARAVLTFLIAAMLAGAQSVRETQRLAVIGVVDVSGSVRRFVDFEGTGSAGMSDMGELTRRLFSERLEGRGPDDLFGLVVFDGRAVTIATPARAGVLGRSMDVQSVEGSDIAGALRHAAALVPPDATGRLVLVSDGNATGADPVEVAAELGTGAGGVSIPIDVIPLSYRVDDEVIVERLDSPPRAAGGSVVPLRVEIRSTGYSTGTLRVLREGEPVDLGGGGRRLRLTPGRHVEILEVPLETGRLSRFEAVYEPDVTETGLSGDRSLENNRAEAFTISPGESRVLLVDGLGASDAGGAALGRALRRSGLDVEVVSPGGMPRELLGLQAHDVVILQNVSADEMPVQAGALLSAYVRELGGGLIVVGGPNTLGAGGWRGSEMEAILPVHLDLPEQMVTPESAIVIVLDNSGSMRRPVLGSSLTQQEVANEAAARAIMSLDDHDQVGVIAFNSVPSVVAELGPATAKRVVAERTRSIASGGGTNIGPALQIAREQLLAIDAKHKHVILLSDGHSMGARALPDLAASMRAEGIRISSIAVGDDADLLTLEQIANMGEGAFYHVLNPNVLPNVFLKAVRVVRSPLIREQPFDVVMLDTGSPLTEGLGRPPRLGGLVLTRAREEPTITYAMASPQGEPVLAHWPVELGQVAVFTSDAHRWASAWLDWPGYEMMWARAVRLLSRSTGQELGELRVTRDEGRLRIEYDAYDETGAPVDLLTVPAVVHGPGGEPAEVRLRQVGPGRYAGETSARRGGNHLVIAKPRAGMTPLPPLIAGATVSSGEEYRRLSSDVQTLARIAEVSGGRVIESDETGPGLFDRAGIVPRRTYSPLWPVLLAWTLLVFLLDVGTRRIAWDRLLPERGTEAELARIAAGAGRSVSALRGVKGRRTGTETRAETFSDRDAERLARDARVRRYEAQQAEIRAMREKARPAEPAKKTVEKVEGTQEEATGLMAAKMRARKRFEAEEDE